MVGKRDKNGDQQFLLSLCYMFYFLELKKIILENLYNFVNLKKATEKSN